MAAGGLQRGVWATGSEVARGPRDDGLTWHGTRGRGVERQPLLGERRSYRDRSEAGRLIWLSGDAPATAFERACGFHLLADHSKPMALRAIPLARTTDAA